MARLTGKKGSVTIGASGVYGVKSWEIDAKCDAVDVTGMDSGGAKEFLSGLTEWNGTIECFLDSENFISNSVLGGAPVSFSLVSDATTPKITCSGSAILTGWKPSVSVEGAVTLSITFQGTGTLTASVS